ncbi:phosphatase PAP2 family protein [Streptomyces sp. NBC_01497]|uniref:phosphatase PAP2 family protein n=1 Tax=Streptomyces sp. NBC_01497 TaxID=2903885 RepID=UPI002E3734B7|nr:phosphatase PAP2 family protein [Streptomyces sp. NBC_01497]
MNARTGPALRSRLCPAGPPRPDGRISAAPAGTTGQRSSRAPGLPADTAARPPLVRELALVVSLFLVYKLGRQLAEGRTDQAFRNARDVWHLERDLHLPDEADLQHLLLHGDTLVHLANTYYAAVHFPATVLFLGWLYLKRPRHYLWSRRVLTAVTGGALVLHLLVPLAPPRMLGLTGLVDTARLYGPSVYAADPSASSVENQFAAMPSLHFAWALMVAIGLIAATASRLRWLWLLHPLLTLFVIIATANHYWLDTLVATALLVAALALLRVPSATAYRGGGLVVRRHLPGPRTRPPAGPGRSARTGDAGSASTAGAARTAGVRR